MYLKLGIQHSNSLCVISCFFLYILSSSQDKMYCQLSLTVCICTPCQRASFNSTTDSFSWGHDPYTLACKARPSFDRCGTSLSVSLSLSPRCRFGRSMQCFTLASALASTVCAKLVCLSSVFCCAWFLTVSLTSSRTWQYHQQLSILFYCVAFHLSE